MDCLEEATAETRGQRDGRGWGSLDGGARISQALGTGGDGFELLADILDLLLVGVLLLPTALVDPINGDELGSSDDERREGGCERNRVAFAQLSIDLIGRILGNLIPDLGIDAADAAIIQCLHEERRRDHPGHIGSLNVRGAHQEGEKGSLLPSLRGVKAGCELLAFASGSDCQLGQAVSGIVAAIALIEELVALEDVIAVRVGKALEGGLLLNLQDERADRECRLEQEPGGVAAGELRPHDQLRRPFVDVADCGSGGDGAGIARGLLDEVGLQDLTGLGFERRRNDQLELDTEAHGATGCIGATLDQGACSREILRGQCTGQLVAEEGALRIARLMLLVGVEEVFASVIKGIESIDQQTRNELILVLAGSQTHRLHEGIVDPVGVALDVALFDRNRALELLVGDRVVGGAQVLDGDIADQFAHAGDTTEPVVDLHGSRRGRA